MEDLDTLVAVLTIAVRRAGWLRYSHAVTGGKVNNVEIMTHKLLIQSLHRVFEKIVEVKGEQCKGWFHNAEELA
eukprot:2504393-Amphidinium_carterae.1